MNLSAKSWNSSKPNNFIDKMSVKKYSSLVAMSDFTRMYCWYMILLYSRCLKMILFKAGNKITKREWKPPTDFYTK